jgi:hypothetical protein
MKGFFTAALFVACALGIVPRVSAQQPEPPHAILPQPIRLPPDFRGKPLDAEPHPPVFDAAKAQKRAQELAKLADQLPDDIHQVSQNVLPKDLIPKLKKIEKLAKQLRKQVAH